MDRAPGGEVIRVGGADAGPGLAFHPYRVPMGDQFAHALLDLADGDPARTFVVLKYVAAQADTEVRPSEAGLARDAIARLEARFKGQIQAGLNIAAALQIVPAVSMMSSRIW